MHKCFKFKKKINFSLKKIEEFIRSHSHHSKDRINELSAILIENQVLIQLANSDTKEFLIRWNVLHENAAKKIEALYSSISDAQSWEKKLLELESWIDYMDKYLTTRISKDIFADDVPDDFAVIDNSKNF